MTLTQGETDEEGNVKLRKLGNFGGGGGGKYVVAALLAVLLSAHFSFADTPTFNIGASDNNTSVVNFGGQQWWAIGQNTETNTARLLLKSDSTETGYDSSTFRSYGTGKNGYDGTFTDRANEYADSTLQRAIQGIADALSVKEQAVIQARTSADLQDGVGNTPFGTANVSEWVELDPQKLWALSYDEWSAVEGDATIFTGRSGYDYYSDYFWLRSPLPDYLDDSLYGSSGGSTWHDHFLSYNDETWLGVRPAFDLDLTNVAGYATLDSGAYKFTFYDNSIAAPD
ncbi:MAG: hypothetical protein LBN39_05765, partial [Planctomycetaceae bacterium]|nr:hypothetical protein [Planctomycetaceae bacterium]